MKKQFKEFLNIEKSFFELNDDSKIACMKLEFRKPSDIFDRNTVSKIPVLSDDFISWVSCSFDMVPRGYKIDLQVSFDDMENYDNEQLQDVFKKNIVLEFKKTERKARSKNIIAYSLIALGVVFFVSMLLVTNLWKNGGLAKDIFKYVADIATTVTFWEAMTILVVENKERRSYMKNLYTKFEKIDFIKK